MLARREAVDREFDAELQHYLEECASEHERRGLSPRAARQAAQRELQHSVTATREQVRAAGWEHLLSDLGGDLRLAVRTLTRQPLLTLVVVLVIAVGSGAVTTIYSAMNALLLRPVPGVADVETLVAVQPMRRNGEVLQQTSFARYATLRDEARTLAGLAAWGRVAMTIADAGAGGVSAIGNMVSANYFDVLGVEPVAGRFFDAGDDTVPGTPPHLVVSHAFWQLQLDGDPAAIGRTLHVNGHPFTLIGVAPAMFRGVYTGMLVDAWVPVSMQPHLRPRSDLLNASWLWAFGRLAPGQGQEGVASELSALTERWAEAGGAGADPRAVTAARVSSFSGLPNGEGRPMLAFMTLLLGAATLVLAIAGVNVATLLSARYIARQRELAVRAALGAGRTRLLRHLVTEVLVLCLLGALGGFALALLATAALERLPLPANLPLSLELSPDVRVLAFALAVTTGSGLLFGLPPALRTARRDIVKSLRDDSSRGGTRRNRLSQAMVVGQLALSLVLLVSAGLFMRALGAAAAVETGFDTGDVVVATLETESWGYDERTSRDYYARLLARVDGTPGIVSAGYTGRVPLMMGRSPDQIVTADGRTLSIDYASVGPGYFDVLRLPLLRGRAFSPTDAEASARVAVINETMAARVWPDRDPVGETFRFRDEVTTVVGIARDARYASLDEDTPSFVYLPLAQVWQPTQTLLLRVGRGGTPATVMQALREAVPAIDRRVPPPRLTTLAEATDIVMLPQRAGAIVTGALGAAGLLLAAVGLYGLMAFSAGRRTREIGIRMALGASRASVLGLLVGDGVRLASTGVVLGLVLAALAARGLAPYLFSVSPFDPVTFLAMSVALVLVAVMASLIPARRAATADPLEALRQE